MKRRKERGKQGEKEDKKDDREKEREREKKRERDQKLEKLKKLYGNKEKSSYREVSLRYIVRKKVKAGTVSAIYTSLETASVGARK